MDRTRLYKNRDKNADELRRRRFDQSVELRKAKKEEQLQKRRNILITELDEYSPLKEKQTHISGEINFDDVVRDMQCSDSERQHSAVQLCRKSLSRNSNPPIEHFFDRGAVKILINILSSDSDDLVFEATWALTNIASGDSKYTAAVVGGGAVPKLITLLDHSSINVAEQSVWALGNIAGDGAQFRDLLVHAEILSPILRLLERVWDLPGVVSNIAWVLSNLCRYRDPPPSSELLKSLLPVLNQLLQYDKSKEVVADSAWALVYASDTVNNIIDDILSSGCVGNLLRLLSSTLPNIVSPAVRAIGNLVVGNDIQTQAVIDCGLLPYIQILLQSERWSIVKETCWVVSNITAGNEDQIQAVIDHHVIPFVLQVLFKGDFKSQKEACWVISNMITGGTDVQTTYLLDQQAITALGSLLTVSEAKVVLMVLECLQKLFELADRSGRLDAACVELETCGALDDLEHLQDHSNEHVYNLAFHLIGTYFGDGDDSQPGDDTEPALCTSNEHANIPAPVADEFQFIPPETPSDQLDNLEF